MELVDGSDPIDEELSRGRHFFSDDSIFRGPRASDHPNRPPVQSRHPTVIISSEALPDGTCAYYLTTYIALRPATRNGTARQIIISTISTSSESYHMISIVEARRSSIVARGHKRPIYLTGLWILPRISVEDRECRNICRYGEHKMAKLVHTDPFLQVEKVFVGTRLSIFQAHSVRNCQDRMDRSLNDNSDAIAMIGDAEGYQQKCYSVSSY
ncbi:hypothetical protein EDC04DRAFT_2609681 [Pisolithus marmoratus]|nr:hypothetical protein EDC04DRAFT_2609681 [Pisolithus marmoratus]